MARRIVKLAYGKANSAGGRRFIAGEDMAVLEDPGGPVRQRITLNDPILFRSVSAAAAAPSVIRWRLDVRLGTDRGVRFYSRDDC